MARKSRDEADSLQARAEQMEVGVNPKVATSPLPEAVSCPTKLQLLRQFAEPFCELSDEIRAEHQRHTDIISAYTARRNVLVQSAMDISVLPPEASKQLGTDGTGEGVGSDSWLSSLITAVEMLHGTDVVPFRYGISYNTYKPTSHFDNVRGVRVVLSWDVPWYLGGLEKHVVTAAPLALATSPVAVARIEGQVVAWARERLWNSTVKVLPERIKVLANHIFAASLVEELLVVSTDPGVFTFTEVKPKRPDPLLIGRVKDQWLILAAWDLALDFKALTC